MWFGFVIRFIGLLKLVTTKKFSVLANSHTLQFTATHTKPSQFVFSISSLVTDPNNVLFCLHRYQLMIFLAPNSGFQICLTFSTAEPRLHLVCNSSPLWRHVFVAAETCYRLFPNNSCLFWLHCSSLSPAMLQYK
jgi:hypothetical protein